MKMEKQYVTTSETPKVELEIHGNLRLKGWDELQVGAKTDTENNLSIEQQDDTIRVRSFSDSKVSVPRQARVFIKVVDGDVTIKGLEGELTVQEAKSNLTLHGSGTTIIQNVDGNLTAKNVAGDFNITSINGNATLRDIQGDFTVSEAVKGNLTLNDVSGNVSAKAGGNISVSFDPAPGEQYDLSAGGNLFCNLSADASVAVHVNHVGNATVTIPGAERTQTDNEPFDFTLGDGDAKLTLSADGNVVLGTQTPGWDTMGQFGFDFGKQFEGFGQQFEGMGKQFEDMAESIGDQFSQQIDAQMEMISAQIEAQLSGLTAHLGATNLSAEQQARVAERARQAGERANERVQEKMRRAQEKLDRKIAEAQRRTEQRTREAERRTHIHERHGGGREQRGAHFNWPTPPIPPAPPSDPVSDDERMVILRMLEQKKISPEQAEQLLSALEGKGA
jgi:hypothetical protein